MHGDGRVKCGVLEQCQRGFGLDTKTELWWSFPMGEIVEHDIL